MKMKFNVTKAAEKKWLSSLTNMPNGVMIYNIEENQVIFENPMIKEILSQNSSDNLFSQ
jgi:c-di-AMP phosphodiesterase-like protein